MFGVSAKWALAHVDSKANQSWSASLWWELWWRFQTDNSNTGNTSAFFPSSLLIINKLPGVVFFFFRLHTSRGIFVNLTANMENGEMPRVWDPPPSPPSNLFFSFNNSWRLKETSHRNLSILYVNNAVWNLMAWVILSFFYTHISFQ